MFAKIKNLFSKNKSLEIKRPDGAKSIKEVEKEMMAEDLIKPNQLNIDQNLIDKLTMEESFIKDIEKININGNKMNGGISKPRSKSCIKISTDKTGSRIEILDGDGDTVHFSEVNAQ